MPRLRLQSTDIAILVDALEELHHQEQNDFLYAKSTETWSDSALEDAREYMEEILALKERLEQAVAEEGDDE